MVQSQYAVASQSSKHWQESSWTQVQQSGLEQSQIRSGLQTWSARFSSHWCPGDPSPPQLWQGSSLLWSLMGETLRGGRSEGFLILSISTSLCFIRVCCFSPFTEAASYSQWSHLSSVAAGSLEVRGDEFCCFLARNSALLLAFLRRVEGLAFFLVTWLVTTSSLWLRVPFFYKNSAKWKQTRLKWESFRSPSFMGRNTWFGAIIVMFCFEWPKSAKRG